MNNAEDLFNVLNGFVSDPDPGTRLVEYCKDVLSGVERIHFDFKQKSDRRDAQLQEDDKKNLAKALCGFANGAGGVLIWGIADSGVKPKPIASGDKFVANLLELGHQATSPGIVGIDGILIPAKPGTSEGFAVIYVPESNLPPHRVALTISEVKNHYYVRSGSAFSIATHSQLEDMFGRRPRPNLELEFGQCVRVINFGDYWEMTLEVNLKNKGRGIGKYPYASLTVDSPHGICPHGTDGNRGWWIPLLELGPVTGSRDNNRKWIRVGSHHDKAIHPSTSYNIAKLVVQSEKGYESYSPVCIHYELAAEGMLPRKSQLQLTADELERLHVENFD